MNLSKLSNKKIVIYGKNIDYFHFEKPYIYNRQGISKENSLKSINKNTEKSLFALNRTRQNIYRIIECNKGIRNSFLTLTFKKNIKNLKDANAYFNLFIKKLKYNYIENLQYLVVPEFQKRGAIHYHIVIFNSPYIQWQKIKKIWRHGSIDIQETKKIKNLSAYVSKYLSKNSFDNRLIGQKAYFTSRNIIRPITMFNEDRIDTYLDSANIESVELQKTYSSFGRNVVNYKKLIIK